MKQQTNLLRDTIIVLGAIDSDLDSMVQWFSCDRFHWPMEAEVKDLGPCKDTNGV